MRQWYSVLQSIHTALCKGRYNVKKVKRVFEPIYCTFTSTCTVPGHDVQEEYKFTAVYHFESGVKCSKSTVKQDDVCNLHALSSLPVATLSLYQATVSSGYQRAALLKSFFFLFN